MVLKIEKNPKIKKLIHYQDSHENLTIFKVFQTMRIDGFLFWNIEKTGTDGSLKIQITTQDWFKW